MFSFKKILPFLIILLIGLITFPLMVIFSAPEIKDNDLQRIAHISVITEAIERVKKSGLELPIPGDAAHLYIGKTHVGYQGVISEKMFRQLGIKVQKDPKTNEPYYFYLDTSGESYEILALLDTKQHSNAHVFYDQNSFSKGTSIGNFIRINTGKFAGDFLHNHTKSGQHIDLLDPDKREMLGLFIAKTCADLIEKKPNTPSGIHLLNINHQVLPAYCDMETDGGGWTLFYANHGYDDSPDPALSYIQLRDQIGSPLSKPLHDYENPYLNGLLDYNHFTRYGSREVLITNNAKGKPSSWLKATFSTPNALHWALGPEVLGSSEEACLPIPDNGTWSVTNQSSSIDHQHLRYMMNHVGASWGISHDRYWCNEFVTAELAHLGFYVAYGDKAESRTRSTQGIGGKWGGKNQFRYFIR